MITEQDLIEKIAPVLKRHPVKKAALFGSFARGEQRQNSDVDIILELDLTSELPDVIYVIWDDLEKSIHLKIDIMTFHGYHALDFELVYSIAVNRVPPLYNFLKEKQKKSMYRHK